ncbi:MAG TPA: EAL domain-containing protein [Thermoanaerobaculia bacterium]|nr:EAL domain-containing protein [Thermoanaerobaculia bacterium]
MKCKRQWVALLLALPLCVNSAWGIDPALSLDQNVVRTWTVDQGLPQGTVYALTQSADGYIWAATQEGFVRFDGTDFVTYDKASVPQIRNNMTLALLAARDGSLYAATNGGGVVHIDGRRVRSFGVADGLPSDAATALYESGNGTLWIGTQKGLARRQSDGRIVPVAMNDGRAPLFITTMTEDWSGQLWIGTMNGVATLKDGRITRHDAGGFPDAHILAIRVTRDGSIWIGTRGGGLVRYRSGQFRTYTTAEGLPSANVSSIFEDSRGTVWIGTLDHGVGRFRDEKFDFSSDSTGIGKKAVTSFIEDREGNIWVGSANGLTRIADGRVIPFTMAHGLFAEKIRTVTEDANGTLWIGSGSGLQTLGGKHLGKGKGLSSDQVTSTWSGRDGSLWAGTFDGGVNRVFEGRTTTWDVTNGLNSNMVLSLFEDRGGVMWVGTARGLQKIVNGTLARDVFKLSGEAVGVIYEDRNGVLWAGTQDGGLNRIAGATVTSFTKANGLASDLILALHQDSTGALWVGTSGGGLSRYKAGRWTTITTREGLFDDSVFSILEDDNGFLWMSSNKGIFRVSRQQLDDFAEGVQPKVTSVAYGKADGMQSRECNGGTQPVAWKSADGKLWFATVKGLAMIDPARARAAAAPPVLIQDIFGDRKRLDPSGPLTLAAGTKSLEFRYTALNLSAPEKVHYQYRLEGFDKEWIDAGKRRIASYTNLPSGSYRFQVRAAIDDGPWSTGTTSFSQRAFFYQTPWFLTASAVLIVGSIAGAHRARVKLVRASAERFKQLFDRNPAGEYRANAAGGILDCNDACARMLGFASRSELMAHGISDLYASDTEWQTMVARLREQGSLASFETALRRVDGTEIWVLMNASATSDGKGHTIVAATLVDITDRKRAEEEVRYRAHHDVLTGLPNRALFKDRLTIALNYAHRHGNQLAVLCLDLDRFNVVNEAFGREGGDRLLQQVADRLKACMREEDSVARVGDDEFTILIMKPTNVSDVTAVARKILQTIAHPMSVDDHEFNMTTSIGIAFYPQDGGDAESLLKNADSALYQAKEAGRNSFQLCSPFLARKAAERLSLENALHQALERHEFVLHYQPQLDLRTHSVTGMEALIRWDRGGKNMLRPAEFIGVAEDTRLILPIGEWAIEEACRQGQAWHSEGTGMRIAVNVSARQFQQPNVVSMIRDAVERSGFDPQYLEIEITESTAMQDPDLTAEILLDLKNLGMSIAIDDFGVGHSSLNYLKRFPIDTLKIDQSFVQDITRGGSDGAIVSAVIAMGKALNIRVIAEGVETTEQLKFLKEHGCYEFQGYLFSRPMAANALTEMINTASPGAYTHRYARTIQAVPSTDH